MFGPFWYLFRLMKAFDSGQPEVQVDLYKDSICVDSGGVISTDFRQLLQKFLFSWYVCIGWMFFCVGGYLEHIYWLVEHMVGGRSVTFDSSVGMC